MQDRNVVYSTRDTIKWDDFSEFVFGLKVGDMGHLMNSEYIVKSDDGIEHRTRDLAFIARSIVKLQSLGVFQHDFKTTLGTISPNYIDRLHVTYFGQKILEYISADKADEQN